MSDSNQLFDNNTNALLNDLRKLIEQGKHQAVIAVNSVITLTYWQVEKRINMQSAEQFPDFEIVSPLVSQLNK